MPLYEYSCESCGKQFERYSAGGAGKGGEVVCPNCGKSKVKKVFSTFASTGCCGGAATTGSAGGCGGGSGHFS